MHKKFDVIVIGAGCAGLACATQTSKSGLKTLILEARDRAGGRILTARDPKIKMPIELGAEFIHGKAPYTEKILENAGLHFYDASDKHTTKVDGKFRDDIDFWEEIGKVTDKLNKNASPDRSFTEFLEHLGSSVKPQVRELATAYIEGFDAAEASKVSERGLALAEEGDDEMDRATRLVQGYSSVPEELLKQLTEAELHFNREVKEISWSEKEGAQVTFENRLTRQSETVDAKYVVITVPIGVLKSGFKITPYPDELKKNLEGVEMGFASRMTLRFKERFWEEHLDKAGYLHLGPMAAFPTWWTYEPLRTPLLTAWAGGSAAIRLRLKSEEEWVSLALENLAEFFDRTPRALGTLLEGVYRHDWTNDPFSMGAYSYIAKDGVEKAKRLSQPIGNTLFIAGEGTMMDAHRGTVEGALKSGIEAAKKIIGHCS